MKIVRSPYLTQPSAAATVNGVAYIAGGSSNHIVVVDGTPKVVQEYDAGDVVSGLVTDDTHLYAVIGAVLTKFDTDLDTVATASVAGSGWLGISSTTLALQGRLGQVEFRSTTDLAVSAEYRAPFVVGFALGDTGYMWLFERNGSGVIKYNLTTGTAEVWHSTRMNGARSGYIDDENVLHVVCDGGYRLVRYDLDDFSFVSTTAYAHPTTVFYDNYNGTEIVGTKLDDPRGTLLVTGDSKSLYIAASGGVVEADGPTTFCSFLFSVTYNYETDDWNDVEFEDYGCETGLETWYEDEEWPETALLFRANSTTRCNVDGDCPETPSPSDYPPDPSKTTWADWISENAPEPGCDCNSDPGSATTDGMHATVPFAGFDDLVDTCVWTWTYTDAGDETLIQLTYYVDSGDWGIQMAETYADLSPSKLWAAGGELSATCTGNKMIFTWADIPETDPPGAPSTRTISVGV